MVIVICKRFYAKMQFKKEYLFQISMLLFDDIGILLNLFLISTFHDIGIIKLLYSFLKFKLNDVDGPVCGADRQLHVVGRPAEGSDLCSAILTSQNVFQIFQLHFGIFGFLSKFKKFN